ncbi:LAFE_0F10462g1_1 [Lachancea fermentati]|uniref:Peptide hydrolase n=1 Tax=Lachancea fermentati TaxID=4955 RepID=A0A1G4MFP7_LACFM|nr:LAFE_0F10462g1_1 [Lachancea fermentati]
MLLNLLLTTVLLLRTVVTIAAGAEFYDATLKTFLSLTDTGDSNLLLPFNKTRIPGSSGSEDIQKFIISHFKLLHDDWLIETDPFQENGYNFTNLVFTLGRNASSYLVLAAHYDSKILPTGFIGGTDSAAPCAILLYISSFIDWFCMRSSLFEDSALFKGPSGIKIVFFDGEEAINQWSEQDSIYGARHLASMWIDEEKIDEIDLFILMDLLGSEEDIKVPSYHESSHFFYQFLSAIERSLIGGPYGWNVPYFDDPELEFTALGKPLIEDDHKPFLAEGVPVLHLIPFPFPSTWHTLNDDFDHLSEIEIHKWAVLLCEFIIQYSIDSY